MALTRMASTLRPRSDGDATPHVLQRVRTERLLMALAAVACLMGVLAQARAQSLDALVELGVQIRIETQELAYLKRTSQISDAEHAQRTKTNQDRDKQFRERRAELSRAQQGELGKLIDSRYAIVFPPIKTQWDTEERRLKDEAKALSDLRAKEMEADAKVAAELQTERTFRLRYVEQNTLSAAEAKSKNDADAAQLAALQAKYASYGGSWLNNFNKRFQQLGSQMVTARDLKERLEDTSSEVGRDAHRVVELNSATARNERRRIMGAINVTKLAEENAPLVEEANTIKAKYAVGASLAPSARDFNERVSALYRAQVTSAVVQQWDREAQAEAQTKRAAAAPSMTPSAATMTPRAPATQPSFTPDVKEMSDVQAGLLVFLSVLGHLALFVLPWWLIPHQHKSCESTGGAFELPDSLRHIDLYKLSYEVYPLSGVIFDREMWTETHVSTTSTGGSVYTVGDSVHSTPGSTSTHISTSVNRRYWIRKPDGSDASVRFSSDVFPAAPGQVITAITHPDGWNLLSYNHSTGYCTTLTQQLQGAHRMPTGRLWLMQMVATLLLNVGLGLMLIGASGITFACAVIPAALVWLIYLRVVAAIVQRKRTAKFEREYAPAFKGLLKEATPELMVRMGGVSPA